MSCSVCRRAVPNVDFFQCLVKGRCLFGELAAGISQTTLYTSFTELSTNGWSYTDEYNTVGFSGVGVSDEIIEDLQWRTKDFVYAGYEVCLSGPLYRFNAPISCLR